MKDAVKFLTPALLATAITTGTAGADTHEVARDSLSLYAQVHYTGAKQTVPAGNGGCVRLPQPFVAKSATNSTAYDATLFSSGDCANPNIGYIRPGSNRDDFRPAKNVRSIYFRRVD